MPLRGIAGQLETDGGSLAFLIKERDPGTPDARVEFRLEVVPGGVELGWSLHPDAAHALGAHLMQVAREAKEGT